MVTDCSTFNHRRNEKAASCIIGVLVELRFDKMPSAIFSSVSSKKGRGNRVFE
jgi:hypothetical protein